MKKAIHVKINIKPVYSNMIHTGIWEGPCRVGPPEILDPEYERRTGLEHVKQIRRQLEANLDLRYCNILEPAYIEWDESFVVPDSEMAKLEADLPATDVFLLNYRVPGIERYGKAVSMIDNGPTPLDVMGFYHSIGIDGFFAESYEDYNRQLRLRYVKKATANTKWLILSATEQITETGNCSINDLYSLYQKYGIRNNRLPMALVFAEMDQMAITDSMKTFASQLLSKASFPNAIKEDMVVRDVKFYEAVHSIMEKYGCNGFTISCKALCAGQLPYSHKITPCLCHSLNKDAGIPSACEEDISALLTMTLFTYLAHKAIYMGNPVYIPAGRKTYGELSIPCEESMKNAPYPEDILEIHHAVPSRKMGGYDTEDMPYYLSPFTFEGFGSRMQIDMTRSAPCSNVTVARFNRTGDGIIVAKAHIIGTQFRDSYCSPYNRFLLEGNVPEFRQRLVNGNYGAHLCMAYGDYVKDWQSLGELMGFHVEYFR